MKESINGNLLNINGTYGINNGLTMGLTTYSLHYRRNF